MARVDTELIVGSVLLLAVGVLVYISLHLGRLGFTGSWGYPVWAEFSTAGGLQPGAVIELAGVEIGRVESVDLANYHAKVVMKIRQGIALADDTRIAIKSKGLIGERFVEVTPGKSTQAIKPGAQFRNTEAPVDIQDLIAKFIFGNVEQKAEE